MILIFIERTDAFAINKEEFQRFSILLNLENFCPAPESFRAWIDSWTDAKAALVTCIDNDSIKRKRFPGTVLSCDTNNPYRFIDPREEFMSFPANYVLLANCVKLYHVDRLAVLNDLIYLNFDFRRLIFQCICRLFSVLRVNCLILVRVEDLLCFL